MCIEMSVYDAKVNFISIARMIHFILEGILKDMDVFLL